MVPAYERTLTGSDGYRAILPFYVDCAIVYMHYRMFFNSKGTTEFLPVYEQVDDIGVPVL